MATIKCTAAGDAMIFRKLPGLYEGFSEVRDYIAKGDLRFVNLETTVHNFETFGNAESGGSWFCTRPAVLEDVKQFGFNMLSTANNHAMDYGHAGLVKTLEYIEKAGLQTCGTGRNLAEASAPVYLETPAGRIAVIGASSSFHPADMAGTQSPSMIGRPGLNGIRNAQYYTLPKADFEILERIAGDIQINTALEISRKEGYSPALPEGTLSFGPLQFRMEDSAGNVTRVHEGDLKRVLNSIREAHFMADYVVVAMHSHQLSGDSKEQPAQFLQEFSRRCIDGGADAIVGTGPHLLRPIEIYKGKPIFYSLGDFIIQLETPENVPADMFEKQGLGADAGMDTMFNKRSKNGTRGLYYTKVMFESVIPYWEVTDGKLTKLTLMPIELNFDKPKSQGGWPRICKGQGILERLAAMSESYGTKMTIRDGIGEIEL